MSNLIDDAKEVLGFLFMRHLEFQRLDGGSGMYNNNSGSVVSYGDGVDLSDRYPSSNYDDISSNNNNQNLNRSSGRDAYEFVAFLLWYLFLVLCCVIPTCCAYRRRRLVEARIANQQASVNRIERQNLFILSSLRQSQQHTEQIREQRGEKLKEKLRNCTLTVEEHNLVEITGEGISFLPCQTCVVSDNQPQPTSGHDDEHVAPNENRGKVDNTIAVEYDVEAADPENTYALKIPSTSTVPASSGKQPERSSSTDADVEAQTATASTRLVPGACAICLCPYEKGEEVIFSPRAACQHAFHSECIIPWLAKADEPKCPCCRQDYCDPIPIAQLELDTMSVFGATAGLVALRGNSFTGVESDDGFELSHFMRSLEASRLEFLTTLEIAAIEASARAQEFIVNNNTTNDDDIQNEGVAPLATATTITSGLFGGTPFEVIDNAAGVDEEQQRGQVEDGGDQAVGSPFEVVISNVYTGGTSDPQENDAQIELTRQTSPEFTA